MLKQSKILSVTVLLALVSSFIASCASMAQQTNIPTITVAFVEDDPGEAGSPTVDSAYSGAFFAAQEIGQRAGVNINLVPYADQGDSDIALQVAGDIAKGDAVAVIGHSRVETLRAAGGIYDYGGLSVLNYVPVTEKLTSENPHLFNTTYTVESEAAYLANYLRKTNNAEYATIFSTDDGYSQSLAGQFKNTFVGLGGEITHEGVIGERTIESMVTEIISADLETSNPGTIFIAADDKTAAAIVIYMRQKGVSFPIAGGSNLSTPEFLAVIEDQVEEKTFPGYYTNGILTTRALIFDSGNRYANQFRHEYQQVYGDDPSDRVVNGYDAMLVLGSIIQRSGILTNYGTAKENREKIYDSLLALNDSQGSVPGLISSIYFEPSRNIIRSARFGVYQNGEVVSANTQFEPITAPSTVRNLADLIEKGRVMTVNGAYVYKANVVYAGVDILNIEEIDIKTSTYLMDFYLWFRYRPNEQDEDFKPDDFVFTNLESGDDPQLIREEVNPDGTVLKTYRVSGTFKNQFRFYEYPFDHQNLVIEFRNQNATTTYIQYVVDQVGMRYYEESELLENYRGNGAFDSIYGWDERSVSVMQDVFPTYSTLGSLQNIDLKVATNYSLINLAVDIQRSSLQYIIKSLLPLLITLILSYITFFLPVGHSERLAAGSAALLATAFFHLTLADSLPEIGYTVAMEYLFYASYVMSALIVLLETLSVRYENKGEQTKKKTEKAYYEIQRQRLSTLGRIVYPSILIAVMIAGYYVYEGVITLSPKDDEPRRLVDVALESGSDQTGALVGETSQSEAGDVIKLRLITWRPEDEEQLQVLLDEFNVYAKESLGKNIVIDHKPVVSVNYDSILDIQLSGQDGPDLFYVRPFSVDGDIAKYLAPLNDLPAMEDNYDVTKVTPWKDRAGIDYALPFVGVVQGVYYNKDMFEQYGISVPTTWRSLLAAAASIKEQNPAIIPVANALNNSEDSEMFMSIAANFLGGPNGRARLMRTDGSGICYNSEPVMNAFQAIADLEPYLPKDAGTMNSQASKELFFNGQAAMLFGGSWDLKKVSDEAVFSWGVFAAPAPLGQRTYVIFQPDIGIGINKETKHQDEARAFLEWLMTKEAIDLTAQNLVGFYPLGKTKASGAGNISDQKFLDLVNKYPGDIRWMFVEISNKVPRADKIIIRNLYEMTAFGLSAEEAAQRLQNGLGEWYVPAQNCQ